MLVPPELDTALQGGLTRAEQRGKIPSLALLPTLLWMQPSTRVAFWAASTHCWLVVSTHYYPEVLLHRTALNPLFAQPN